MNTNASKRCDGHCRPGRDTFVWRQERVVQVNGDEPNATDTSVLRHENSRGPSGSWRSTKQLFSETRIALPCTHNSIARTQRQQRGAFMAKRNKGVGHAAVSPMASLSLA